MLKLLKNDDNNYLFLQLPMKKTISYSGKWFRIDHSCQKSSFPDQILNVNLNKTRFFLSFPHILFQIHYHHNDGNEELTCIEEEFNIRLSVAFTNSELNEIYYPSLPNIGEISCCMGDFYKNLTEKISPQQIIQDFWNSTFTDEFLFSYGKYLKNISVLKNLHDWENKTKSEPLWIPNPTEMIECSNIHLKNRMLENNEN